MAAELLSCRGRIRPLAVVSISLLAVVSIMLSGLPPAAGVVSSFAVVLAAWRSLARFAGHTIRLDRSIAPALDGERGNLSAEAITSLFVALKLITPNGLTRRAFLFRDELQPDQFRALLAYLRHG